MQFAETSQEGFKWPSLMLQHIDEIKLNLDWRNVYSEDLHSAFFVCVVKSSFWDYFVRDHLITHFCLAMLTDGTKVVIELEGMQLSQWVNVGYWINFMCSLEVPF